ncbi:hypothetical protein BON22_3777 [Cyberlindnera fabianii]|uniref:Uncharacterized protein n=1 Tax=Cyberlindnera fabianii TaxID=36022 RepID=A0A1V2L3F1_CYBFA|nr:hypothetical protein BON22_3777 [Cyberlindnera fabianii]
MRSVVVISQCLDTWTNQTERYLNRPECRQCWVLFPFGSKVDACIQCANRIVSLHSPTGKRACFNDNDESVVRKSTKAAYCHKHSPPGITRNMMLRLILKGQVFDRKDGKTAAHQSHRITVWNWKLKIKMDPALLKTF